MNETPRTYKYHVTIESGPEPNIGVRSFVATPQVIDELAEQYAREVLARNRTPQPVNKIVKIVVTKDDAESRQWWHTVHLPADHAQLCMLANVPDNCPHDWQPVLTMRFCGVIQAIHSCCSQCGSARTIEYASPDMFARLYGDEDDHNDETTNPDPNTPGPEQYVIYFPPPDSPPGTEAPSHDQNA